MKNKVIGPSKTCSICSQTGYMLENGRRVTCLCILKQRAKAYFGPIYANLNYATKINFDIWNHNFLRFEGCSENLFKFMVKSYLIYNNLKLSHYTVSPFDIFEGFYEKEGAELYTRLTQFDFLVILFRCDPPNKLYESLIRTLIDKRLLFNRVTWIFLQEDYDSSWFTYQYSVGLGKYIEEKSKKARSINTIKFKRGGVK